MVESGEGEGELEGQVIHKDLLITGGGLGMALGMVRDKVVREAMH